jgi:hypothetical protein
MIDPAKFDDDWAELARELERDKPSSPPPPTECNPLSDQVSGSVEDRLPVYDTQSDEEAVTDEFGEGGTVDLESETERESDGDLTSEDSQPGTGKKRRRRRRRRRKGGGGQLAEMGATEDANSEKSTLEDKETEEIVLESESVTTEVEYGGESADEVYDESIQDSAEDTDEDAGGELLRELIANWNVPSWDDVVSGLYRPER